MDYALYRSINGLSGNRVVDEFFELVSRGTAAVLVLMVALLFLVPWRARRREHRIAAVTATLAAAISVSRVRCASGS